MNSRKTFDTFVQQWIANQQSEDPGVVISIVVPAYNEERRLPPTLIDMIDYFDQRDDSYEIVVVDDGSSDNTSKVVRKFVKIRSQVRLIQLPRNYGKGHAVRTGVLNARGAFILFADADGSTPIAEVERLIEEVQPEGIDIAIGSRAMYSSDTAVSTVWYRKAIGRVFNFFVNCFLLPEFRDTQCGFKLFQAPAAKFIFGRQQADGFSFDLELLFIAKNCGIGISEVPVNWENVPGSKVNLILDAARMFRDIFVFRVRHRGVSAEDYRLFLESLVAEPRAESKS